MFYKSETGLFYVDDARQVWRVFGEAVCKTELDADVVEGLCSKHEPDNAKSILGAIRAQS